jgi:DNA-binding Xre family transcriptional regulator
VTHLGCALAAYQQKFDVEGKFLARQIGINESTLTRIKQGKMPDAEGLAKIIAWLVLRRS